MSEFDELWRSAARFRRVSRELEPLLREAHQAVRAADLPQLKFALVHILELLASPGGRTDANCETTHYFFTATEPEWRALPESYVAILDDMSGTLHDAIYAPNIARTFSALPEQLLERARAL